MYIAPQIYRNWIPISHINSIDKSKPFVFNLGSLPLILWFHSNFTNPSVMINSCKHLASPLNKATINNNCLICPNHNFIYNNSHNFGSTFINHQDGLIWWAFKPNSNNPFILNHIHNHNYHNSYFNSNYIIKSDIITFILNFIYSFSNDNYYHYKFNHGKLFIKNSLKNQRLLFIYPYTFIIKDDILSSIIKISIRPIPNSNLKVFISTNSSYLFYNIIKIINNISSYHNNFKFKYNLLLSNNYNYNPILDKIYNYYKNNYMDVNDDLTISNFIINHKFF